MPPFHLVRRAAGALLLTLLLAFAPQASADNTADEADIAFQLGNQAFVKKQYDDALRNYFLSHRLVPNRNVLFNIARCYEQLDRFDEAYRYYYDLLRQDPTAEDARDVQRSLQRIRPKVALVEVTSTPEGADVYIDRRDLGSRGRTPLTLALPAGRHTVIVEHAGHQPVEQDVDLVRGREVRAKLELELITGVVSVSGTPTGAWVRETPDGPVVGTVPAVLRLPPGKRILYVGAEKHETRQVLVDVAETSPAMAEIALGPAPKPTGKLVVTANRVNAIVSVDGLESGFTPSVLTLPEGEHKVTVALPELTPLERRITIKAGEEQRLHADLRYSPPAIKAASKSLLSVDEAPASISVITREEIQAFGYTTLAEALSAIRGIYVSDDRIYRYLGIRGFSPPGDLNTRVLILWDGHAMNDVWAGQGFAGHDFAVDLDEVERIEVVRGPGSALYGTGAFFAVINVVPRDSLGTKTHVELTGGTGALGRYRAHLATGIQGELGSVVVSGSALGARGAELTAVGSDFVRGLDGERAYSGTLRARMGDFTLSAFINNRMKDVPTAAFATVIGAPGTRAVDGRGFAELRWDKDLKNDAQASVRAYYDATRYRGQWVYPPESEGAPDPVMYTDAGAADWLGGEARYRFRTFGQNFLTAGVETQLQFRLDQEVFALEGQARPLETRRRTLLSAYLLDEWRLHPRVFLTAGLRVDRYLDLDVTPITPRIALLLKPYEQGITKLVAGQAFRAPNVYELYYHDEHVSQRAAGALAPESITTFELEHAHDLTRELRLTLAGYHNRITQLVVLEQEQAETPGCGSAEDPTQCLVFQNAPGLLRAFGAEAGLRWQPGRHALVDASYSFVRLIGATEDLQSGTPVHLASGRLLVPITEPFVRLALQGTYQSARRGPRVPDGAGEALLLNVGLSGETEHLRYFAGVQNLLDAQYALPVGSEFVQPVVPQYGRTFTVQLTGTY